MPKKENKDKTTVVISASSIDAEQICWRFFQLNKIMRIAPLTTAIYLDQGRFLHLLLEKYYKNKKDNIPFGENVLNALKYGRARAIKDQYPIEMTEEVIRVFREYTEYYQQEQWVPLEVEGPFSRVFYEDDEVKILGEGKIDLLVREEPESIVRVVDHKKVSRVNTPLILDNGVFMYTFATDTDVYIKNDVGFQSGSPEKRFKRHRLHVRKNNLNEWRMDVANLVKESIERFKRNDFPMRLKSCAGKYGPCQYVDICGAEPDNRDFLIKTMFRVSDKHDIFAEEN